MTVLLAICSLLVLSTGYVVQLQSWLMFNAGLENSSQKQTHNSVYSQVGIRTMVSNQELIFNKDVDFSESQVNLQNETRVKTPTLASYKEQEMPALESQQKVSFGPESTRPGNKLKLDRDFPLVVELENEILIEFSDQYSRFEMQKAISRLLVLPREMNAKQIMASNSIDVRQKPYLYKRVYNEYDKPVRYPAQAFRYADYLLNNFSQKVNENQAVYTVVSIPLKEVQIPTPVKTYQAWVDQYSEKNKIAPELVFAIIEVESAFNPLAVSKSNALGLMQIKAKTAGRDVYQYIEGKKGEPGQAELFDAESNIRMGTAYMGLLKHEYLQGVRNRENKEMISISAYNGGISKTLKLFGKTPQEAIMRVNQLHPKRVYRTLRYEHQSNEARLYLDKVLKAKKRYRDLLEAKA